MIALANLFPSQARNGIGFLNRHFRWEFMLLNHYRRNVRTLRNSAYFWPSVATYRTKRSSGRKIIGCHLKSSNRERKVIVTTLLSGLGVSSWRWVMMPVLSLVIQD